MEFDHNNVDQQVVEVDRLSSLPDDLIHKILYCLDMKSAVQTCLLLSRWKLLWASMTCLDFSILHFGTYHEFTKFVTHVQSNRNHQIQLYSVKLFFLGPLSVDFVRKIAEYAFSHNVQELRVFDIPGNSCYEDYPLWLLGSQSLNCFNLSREVTLKAPLDFPALTTLHLSEIVLCGDVFSKCVNLKSLSLGYFGIKDVGVFDIITPRLSRLMLFDSKHSLAINVIAPQLEHLAIDNCTIKYMNAPPGLSSFWYTGTQCWPIQLFEDRLHSLDKVTIHLYFNGLPSRLHGNSS